MVVVFFPVILNSLLHFHLLKKRPLSCKCFLICILYIFTCILGYHLIIAALYFLTFIFTNCKLLEKTSFSRRDLYHVRYQILFSSLKSLTYVHVKYRLSCAYFNIKFPITISYSYFLLQGFQKTKPQIKQTNTVAHSSSCQTPILKLFSQKALV